MSGSLKARIKESLRRLFSALPGGRALFRVRTDYLERRRLASIGDTKRIFLHHYEANEWSNTESASGAGSTLEYTENIRKMIPQLVQELGVSTILDAPCGDYNWFGMIQWEKPIRYLGGDIVKPLIERNRSRYGDGNTTFIEIDIVRDPLPPADLWLCRDCLFHLSQRDIFLALGNFLKSDIRYLLTSTHPQCDRNRDIPTGSFRLLNLELPPYSLCEPIRRIDDWIEGFPVRHLALWEREAVRDSLRGNKAFQEAVEPR